MYRHSYVLDARHCIKTLQGCLKTHGFPPYVIQVNDLVYLNIVTEVIKGYNQWAMTTTLSYASITFILFLFILKNEIPFDRL